MNDLLEQIFDWHNEGERVALATVVSAWGSAPRPLGSKMAVSRSGRIAGSVSGGCVEAAVAEAAGDVLETGTPRLEAYGVSNETAWSVGLSCGGTIEVFVEPLGGELRDLLHRNLRSEAASARVVALDAKGTSLPLLVRPDGTLEGSLGDAGLDAAATELAVDSIRRRASARSTIESADSACDCFVDVFLPQPRLLIVGAVHVAIHLVAFARRLGFRTYVIDPRSVFATPERFAEVDELVTAWPREALERIGLDESSCLVCLSHDLKIDVPALEAALASPALYIGALGSKKTHAKRAARLRQIGFGDGEIARIHAPIGLDLGGRRAEDIALAIIAEISAVMNRGRVERARAPGVRRPE